MAKFERETLGISEAVQYNSNIVYNNMISGSKTALENGITVGLGTDTGCPYTTHYNMWRELHYFEKNVGVSPAFALYKSYLGKQPYTAEKAHENHQADLNLTRGYRRTCRPRYCL